MISKFFLIILLWVVTLVVEIILSNLLFRLYNYYGFNIITVNKKWMIDLFHLILLIWPLFMWIKIIC